MRNKKVLFLTTLVVLVAMGGFIYSKLAHTENTNNQQVEKTVEVKIPTDPAEMLALVMTDQNKAILESYGFPINSNVESVHQTKNDQNRTLIEVTYANKSSVSFDRNGVIMTLWNTNKDTAKVAASIEEMIQRIEANGQLKDGYKLVRSEVYIDEDSWQLHWQKDIGNGVINLYDALKVTLNRKTNSVVSYNRFLMTPDTTIPAISEEEAVAAGRSIMDKVPNIKSKTVHLEVVRPNYFWDENKRSQQADFVRLAYVIDVTNDKNVTYKIYVDAVTREILGGDQTK